MTCFYGITDIKFDFPVTKTDAEKLLRGAKNHKTLTDILIKACLRHRKSDVVLIEEAVKMVSERVRMIKEAFPDLD